MKNNVLITTTGEVCLIKGKLHLEKAALLLKSFIRISESKIKLDPIRGDLGALDGKKDFMYPIEGYEYGARTFIILPQIGKETNPYAQEILEREYNLYDTRPMGNVIITTLQGCTKDLIYNIERRCNFRRKNYPSLEDFKEMIYKEKLTNSIQYFDFLKQHPELRLPVHPDFYYHERLTK